MPARLSGLAAAALAILVGSPASAVAAPAPERGKGDGTGGVTFLEPPEVRRWSCLRRCGPEGENLPGGLMRLRGRALDAVTRVVYHGGPGRADDVTVRVRPKGPRRLTVRVHADAVSGPVTAIVGPRLRSLLGPRVEIGRADSVAEAEEVALAAAPLRPVATSGDPSAPRLETGLDRVQAFYGERSGVTFSYRVSAAAPVSVQVELVRPADGTVVRAWPAASVPLGEKQSVTWRGTHAGVVAPEGRYAFRLTARGGGGVQAQSAQATEPRDAFDFHDHRFPVRGAHDFGGAGARFGTGRAGHSHQGQDLFARCGTGLVAARGGVVKFVQYHAAAGHYLVIDGEGIDQDYVYMHLQGPPPVRRGQRVYTGQPLGAVGASGNARGCHLHFELWGAPGWYDGGRPVDPLPALKAWDAAS